MNDILDRINFLLEAVDPAVAEFDYEPYYKIVEAEAKKFFDFKVDLKSHHGTAVRGSRYPAIYIDVDAPPDKGYHSKCVTKYTFKFELAAIIDKHAPGKDQVAFDISLHWTYKDGGRNGMNGVKGWIDMDTMKLIVR